MRQTRSTPGSSRPDCVDPGASWALGSGWVPPSDAVRRWRPSATRRLASLAGAALRPSNVATTRGATDSPLNGRLRGRRSLLHPLAGTGKSSCRAPARVVDAAQTAMETVEREGCPIKERSLPGVGAHDAGASSTGHAGAAWRGITVGLHPEWLELGEGLTPLLRYDTATTWRSAAGRTPACGRACSRRPDRACGRGRTAPWAYRTCARGV